MLALSLATRVPPVPRASGAYGGTYKILKKLSGKDLGERDDDAWQKWLDEQRGAKGAPKKS